MAPKKPSQLDVLRHWMYVSDIFDESPSKNKNVKFGGKGRPSNTQRLILDDVVQSLISHWKIQGLGTDIKPEKAILDKLDKLVKRVVLKLNSNKHPNRKFDFDWIAAERKPFEETIFDLSISTANISPSVKRNLNAEENTVICVSVFHCLLM